MTKSIGEQDIDQAETELTLTQEIVQLETATETLAAYRGYLLNQIYNEEQQAVPNVMKLKALEAQLNVVVAEQKSITSDNHDLIAKAIYIYAPIMKSLYSSHGREL